jgi:hypothetical protein
MSRIDGFRCVFAVTSRGNDFYSAMTRVAAASIRLTNPLIQIVVACDHETDKRINAAKDPLKSEVDEWLVLPTPEGSDSYRNRFVKISLRQALTGPFLFLDSDILVRDDLSELFKINADLAGARNHSLPDIKDQIWSEDREELDRMSWQTRGDVYVNGGVLLYNDTPGAHRFAEEWQRLWLEGYSKTGRYRDQPALNTAIKSTQINLYVLPDTFNAQFKTNFGVVHNASIWHYYSSGLGDKPETAFEATARSLIRGSPLDSNDLRCVIKSPHPWVYQGALSGKVYAGAADRGYLKGWEDALLRGVLPGYFKGQLLRLFR